MEYCEHCEQTFKTVQGLSGHHRMKHNASTAQYKAEYRPNNERELLQRMQTQLDRLEELELTSSLINQMRAAAIEVHSHGMSDPECPGCIELVRETLNTAAGKAKAETIAYYEEIPGVKNLREAWEESQRIDPDGAHDWTPEVIAAAARGEQLIHIVG